MGEHHYSQLTGRIVIPTDPPAGHLDAQATLFRSYLLQHGSWLRVDLFARVVSVQDYNFWWTGHSVGQLVEGDVYRQHGLELITPTALRRDLHPVAPGPAEFITGTHPVAYVGPAPSEPIPPWSTIFPIAFDSTGSQTSHTVPETCFEAPIQDMDPYLVARSEDDVRIFYEHSLKWMHTTTSIYLERSQELYEWGRAGHERATLLQAQLDSVGRHFSQMRTDDNEGTSRQFRRPGQRRRSHDGGHSGEQIDEGDD